MHFQAKHFASVYRCVHVCIYKTLDIYLPGVLPVDNNCASINEGEHSFNVSIEKNATSNYNLVLTHLRPTFPFYYR